MRELLRSRIFTESKTDFMNLALEVFRFQFGHNEVYRSYCTMLGCMPEQVSTITEIPFLPVSFFKTHRVATGDFESEVNFKSSGTTGDVQATHFVREAALYRASFSHAFRVFAGEPSQWVILALLPSYLERRDSSLVFMVSDLLKQSDRAEGGFFLNNQRELHERLLELEKREVAAMLIGVSFALLDFADQFPMSLQSTVVVETGGMKGRREEITRLELHERLSERLGIRKVWSEYGMTELLSQSYSRGDGVFESPPWMKVLARELSDPLNVGIEYGAANIIDLANLDSCSFLATADIVKIHSADRFEVLGRADYEDVRGCNLMLE